MIRKTTFSSLLTFFALCFVCVNAFGQTISNASFETPSVSNFTPNPAGSSWTWSASRAGIQHNGSAFGAADAPDGTQTAYLQGYSGTLGTMSQSVNFATAGSYTISFQAARRAGQVQPILVSVDGTTVGTYTPASDSFALITTAAFTVTAGNHTIMFATTDSSGDKTSFIDLTAAAFMPAGTPLSRVVPLASVDEWNTPGYLCGDGLQIPVNADNCFNFPDIGFIGGDSHSIWKTTDFGATWRRPTRRGLFGSNSLGVRCDPADSLRVFAYMGANFNPGEGGLYLSTDGAESFTRKIDATSLDTSSTERISHGNFLAMGYAPASISGGKANKWFVVLANNINDNTLTYKSTDGGVTFQQITTGAWGTGRGKPCAAAGDPTDDDVFWIASSTGLYRVDNAFSGTPTYTQHKTGSFGSRPYVSSNGQTVIAGGGGGIWKSINAHAPVGSITFAQQGTFSTFDRASVSPYDPNIIITFRVVSDPNLPYLSTDGSTFTKLTPSQMAVRPGTTRSNTNPSACGSNHALFHSNTNKIFFTGRMVAGPTANNHFRTVDKGANWTLANEGYNGSNVKIFTPSPAMFDISDKDRIFFPYYDVGAWYTDNGAKYFATANNTNMKNARNALPGYTGLTTTGVTCIGAAIHPNANVWLAAAGDYQNQCGIIRSTDNVTWAVPANSVSAKTGGFFYNYSDPGKIMWYNRRSVDGLWATWSGIMTGLDANDCVSAATSKLSGTNYFFATNRFSSGNTVLKRSGDNGASWQTVLTLDYVAKAKLGYSSFACDPFDQNIVYFQDNTTKYQIRKYNLSAGTYTTLNLFGAAGTPQPGTYPKPISINTIAIDPRFPDVMYCTTDPVGQSNLWRSTNGGTAWTPMDGTCEIGLPRNSLMVHPLTGDVFTGSDQGLHVIPPPYAQTGTLFSGLPYDSYVGEAPNSNSVPVITTTTLPGTIAGEAYSQTLAATGGDGALVWSVSAGTLPTGLSLSGGGVISGSATTGGTSNFTVKVADSDGVTGPSDEDTQALSIVVTANSVPIITTTTLPGGTVGTAYSQTLVATGGNDTLVWSLASGTLPAGLSFSTAGVISGTPSAAATSNFTVGVADSDGVTGPSDEDTQALSIVISAAPVGIFDSNEDIGAPAIAGSASFTSGTYTVNGSGTDIYGTADQFQFVHQGWNGDVRLIARVDSVENTHQWAKAALMIRETTAANSRNVDFLLSPLNGIQLTHRATAGGTTTSDAIVPGVSAPYWLKLERHADTFTGWESPDGLLWFLSGAATFTMNTTGTRVGLAVSALDNTTLNTSTFSNVSVTNVPAWIDADIGSDTGALATTVDYTTDTYTLNGAGANIYSTVDGFRFYYQEWSGDATLVAHVLSVQNTKPNAKAGLMIRKSLATNSAHATLDVTAAAGIEFLRRTADGATTSNTVVADLTAPYLLKLVRSGDTFSAYYSPDGGTWTQLGSSVSIPMTGTVYVGLNSCSTLAGTPSTATFESVYIK